jgi:hypothetical protein
MLHLPFRATLAAAILAALAPAAFASSHREAPFITKHPKVDATDFYMFRSYQAGRADFTTLIANYVPLQDAYGGPNYFTMDPEALYEIHIDNNGDAKEDISFQFRFKNTNKDAQFTIGGKKVSIPLVINGGAINDVNPPGLNVRETYTVTMVKGDRRGGARTPLTNADGGGVNFDKPVDNIGTKSIPNYEAYAAKHVYNVNIPGCATPARMFVGQRKDPFAVNLGETFDLINIKAPAVEFDANAEKAPRTTWPSRTSPRSAWKCRPPACCTRRRPIPSSAAGPRPACARAGWSILRPSRTTTPPRKAAPGCRCRAWACRWSTRWSSA